MKEIKLITSNNAKYEWAVRRLERHGINPIRCTIEVPEPREFEVEDVIRHKIDYAKKIEKPPFIIEDTSFQIKSLNGFPSTYIKLAISKLGPERICTLLNNEKDRSAVYKSALGYIDEKGNISVFICESPGVVPEFPKGNNLHGFNELMKIFIPKGFSKTFAEMEDTEFREYERDVEKRDHFVKFVDFIKGKSKP